MAKEPVGPARKLRDGSENFIKTLCITGEDLQTLPLHKLQNKLFDQYLAALRQLNVEWKAMQG